MKSRMINIVLLLLCAGVLTAAAFTVKEYGEYFFGESYKSAYESTGQNEDAVISESAETSESSAESTQTIKNADEKNKNADLYEFAGTFGEFSAQTFDGGTFSEKDLLSCGVNLINVWTTFCSPCIKEMPELNELSEEYAGKVRIIGICADTADENGTPVDKTLELGKKISQSDLSLSYTMLVPSTELQNGILKDVYAYPTTYITDDNGNIYEVIIGRKSKEEFAQILGKYINLQNADGNP